MPRTPPHSDGKHAFWSTQPVPQTEDEAETDVFAGPMDEPKTAADVPEEPYPIASTFEWWTPNMEVSDDIHVIYKLLRDNYVEDDDSMFRFNYSEEFLQWALCPPNYIPDWHVAVRRKADKKLLAFIAGVPVTLRMGTPKSLKLKAEEKGQEEAAAKYDAPRHICEINFLCVHKQLREKRLAPILIKEVTRRVNRTDVWQAVYTAGVLLPTPYASGQYFHRSLNPEKLVEIRFSGIPVQYQKFQNPMAMLKRNYHLPSAPRNSGLREMKPSDVPQVRRILMNYLDKFDVSPVFSDAEIGHYLLPRDGVVFTYVVENEKKVTDFFSFYRIPSTVIGNSTYNMLNAAYVHYYAATSMPLHQLILDLLIVAHSRGFDVCNMVEILDNRSLIEPLKFGAGDGYLRYYFYNWSYPKIKPSQVALVML
ncbi:N-myristoyl transferase, putative [Leishmania panamensis]|uniref:Glycylpeptide N-tetradecanoyltransferase n=1 Tax=Leishmania panamensis TaxID=5679 RepID=A0A088RXK5_LEIPA|nr:N-myristoyl transferase, putative [Leishmania panamensis]AIO00898.1 N-myristoyl transferase, putative [Leishmania panamensis]